MSLLSLAKKQLPSNLVEEIAVIKIQKWWKTILTSLHGNHHLLLKLPLNQSCVNLAALNLGDLPPTKYYTGLPYARMHATVKELVTKQGYKLPSCGLIANIKPIWRSGGKGVISVWCDDKCVCDDISNKPIVIPKFLVPYCPVYLKVIGNIPKQLTYHIIGLNAKTYYALIKKNWRCTSMPNVVNERGILVRTIKSKEPSSEKRLIVDSEFF